MEEIWRNVKDYEGLYQVSNTLKIKNSINGEILNPIKDDKGYIRYNLGGKLIYFHRILGMTFPELVEWTEGAKGKTFDVLYINHKDENPLNNNLNNLQWCTPKDNSNWGTRNKRVSVKNGKPVIQYDKYGQFVKEYHSANEAHRQTKIDCSSITACCRGKLHSAGGYIWKYTSECLGDNRHSELPQDACKIGNGKKVIQFTDNGTIVGVYDSAREAARQTGISNQAISILCRGSINGYRFTYLS